MTIKIFKTITHIKISAGGVYKKLLTLVDNIN